MTPLTCGPVVLSGDEYPGYDPDALMDLAVDSPTEFALASVDLAPRTQYLDPDPEEFCAPVRAPHRRADPVIPRTVEPTVIDLTEMVDVEQRMIVRAVDAAITATYRLISREIYTARDFTESILVYTFTEGFPLPKTVTVADGKMQIPFPDSGLTFPFAFVPMELLSVIAPPAKAGWLQLDDMAFGLRVSSEGSLTFYNMTGVTIDATWMDPHPPHRSTYEATYHIRTLTVQIEGEMICAQAATDLPLVGVNGLLPRQCFDPLAGLTTQEREDVLSQLQFSAMDVLIHMEDGPALNEIFALLR